MGILFTWLDIVRIWSVSSKVPSSVTTVAEPSCSFLVKTSNIELYVMVIGLTWNLLEESYLLTKVAFKVASVILLDLHCLKIPVMLVLPATSFSSFTGFNYTMIKIFA